MDRLALPKTVSAFFEKYKYVLLVIAIGLADAVAHKEI